MPVSSGRLEPATSRAPPADHHQPSPQPDPLLEPTTSRAHRVLLWRLRRLILRRPGASLSPRGADRGCATQPRRSAPLQGRRHRARLVVPAAHRLWIGHLLHPRRRARYAATSRATHERALWPVRYCALLTAWAIADSPRGAHAWHAVSAVGRAMGVAYSSSSLVHAVLQVEQMLTTVLPTAIRTHSHPGRVL
jgi:hypothetical protein